MSDNFDIPRFISDDEPDETPEPYVPDFLTPRSYPSIDSIPDGTQKPDPDMAEPSAEDSQSIKPFPEEDLTTFDEEAEEKPKQQRTPIGAEHQPKAPPPEEQSTFVNPALARVAAAQPRSEFREVGEIWLAFRTFVIVVFAALIVAFIFSYWTPDSFLSEEFKGELQAVSSTQTEATALPSPLPTFSSVQKVGIITGHSGPPLNPAFEIDPGAICDDNNDGIPELTELSINTAVAQRLAGLLLQEGFEVDMLEEWDDRLDNYRASALVSIHTNTCENLGFGANGFNVQGSSNAAVRDRDEILVNCVVQTYGVSTGLPRHFGTSPDLIDYHVFREVSIDTPTIIVELGFMFADRQTLIERPDHMALGIANGLLCFLKPEQFRVEPTPLPSNTGG